MKITFFTNILIITWFTAASLFICHIIKLPVIIGFLFTGILAGPQVLSLISKSELIQNLAEIGIILLLFTIGIEFSFQTLSKFRRPALLGGSSQIILTVLVIFLISRYINLSIAESIIIGFIVSLSSTAIVMKLLQERGEIETPHGNTILGILIFQDIIVVFMMLLIPVLAGIEILPIGVINSVLNPLMRIGLVIFLIIIARWAVPKVLFSVTSTKSSELFFLIIIGFCLGIAWLTSKAGLSLALGAFLAGLIISESEYSHEALSHLLSFRDIFMSFFFISIGMLLDIKYLFLKPQLILILSITVILVKIILATLSAGLLSLPFRNIIISGCCLAQIGEFSFILSASGLNTKIIPEDHYQIFITVSIITMIITPFLFIGAPKIADYISGIKKFNYFFQMIKNHSVNLNLVNNQPTLVKKNHIIIIGFGLNGRNLARAARKAKIPYIIIEMNPIVIKEERAKGEPIFYGDATKEKILQHAQINVASSIVVVINDPAASSRIVWLARKLNSKIYIIVRTKLITEIHNFIMLGANEVIPEEFETSIEIFSRVLKNYLLPKDEIDNLVMEIRAEEYDMFRSIAIDSEVFSEYHSFLPEISLTSLRLSKNSPLINISLANSKMKNKFGLILICLVHQNTKIINPSSKTIFREGDILIVVGQTNRILDFEKNIKGIKLSNKHWHIK